MRLEFFMPMIPPTITAQQQKTRVVAGKPYRYDPPELKAAKAKLTAHLGVHAPAEALVGPVRLMHVWYWPCAGTTHADGQWRDTKPDTDNIAKSLKDCMEDVGFFARSDAQVADETIRKFWAQKPGIYVCVEELT